jgi:hypothetical protein
MKGVFEAFSEGLMRLSGRKEFSAFTSLLFHFSKTVTDILDTYALPRSLSLPATGFFLCTKYLQTSQAALS